MCVLTKIYNMWKYQPVQPGPWHSQPSPHAAYATVITDQREMNNSKPRLFSPFRKNIQQLLWCRDWFYGHKASKSDPPPLCPLRLWKFNQSGQSINPQKHLSIAHDYSWAPMGAQASNGVCKVWPTPTPGPLVLISNQNHPTHTYRSKTRCWSTWWCFHLFRQI